MPYQSELCTLCGVTSCWASFSVFAMRLAWVIWISNIWSSLYICVLDMHCSSLWERTMPPKRIMLRSGKIWKHRWHYWCLSWCACFVFLMSVYNLLLCLLHVRAQVGWTTINQCCFTCMPYQSRLAFILPCVVEISSAVQLLQALP